MKISESQIYEIPSITIVKDGFSLGVLQKLYDQGMIDKTLMLRLELAFQEALTNALEHGNLELHSSWKDEVDSGGADKFSFEKSKRLNDPKYSNRKVRIQVECNEQEIEIIIQDEGIGFELNRLERAHAVNVHGRGIPMIRAHMDTVVYEENGKRIRMKKRFERSCSEPS